MFQKRFPNITIIKCDVNVLNMSFKEF